MSIEPARIITRETLKDWLQPLGSDQQVTTAPEATPSQPVPPADWPWWARILRWNATAGDTGVGDTIHRLLGEFGETFTETLKALGVPCACDRRRAEFNAKYQYGCVQ